MAAEGPRDAFLKIKKKNFKSQKSNFKILVHHFFASVSHVYCKKLDSMRTKLTEEIHFEVFPYGDSGNGTAALQQHDARRDILTEPAAWRRAAIESRGHSELGVHSGRKNQPACLLSCDQHFEVCPYSNSSNGIAAAARRSPGYCNWTAVRRTAAIEARGHSELGAQSGRKNPPACFLLFVSRLLTTSQCLSIFLLTVGSEGCPRQIFGWTIEQAS